MGMFFMVVILAVIIGFAIIGLQKRSKINALNRQGFSKKDRFKGKNECSLFFNEVSGKLAFMDGQNKVFVFNAGQADFVRVLVDDQEVSSADYSGNIRTILLEFKIPEKDEVFQVEFLHCIGKEAEHNHKKNLEVLELAFEWKQKITTAKSLQVKS